MAVAHDDPVPFGTPSEPRPVPSVGSDDDESFVVLGHGPDDYDPSPSGSPVGGSIVREARSLIGRELAALEKREEVPLGGNDGGVLERSGALPEVPRELAAGMVDDNAETSVNTPISIATLPPDLTSEELQNKISEIIEENIHLKDTILQNNMSMKLQYERIVAWKEDVQKVHEAHKQKFIEAKEYIEKLKKELSAKDEELNSLKNKLAVESTARRASLEQSSAENLNRFELDAANKKIKELEAALEELSLEKNEKEPRKEAIEDSGELKEELERVRIDLGRTEAGRVEAMKLYSIESERNRELLQKLSASEYERAALAQQLHEQQRRPASEDVYMVRQQLMSSQAALTECQQGRAEALVKVGELSRELEGLRAEAGGARAEADEVFALRAQLEVYKADFEAERQSKEAMREERDRLAEDLQHLRRRNLQLQEQAERGAGGLFRSTMRSPPSAPPTSESPLKCPKCNFGFHTQNALENHVYRCIELDDNLP